ncbi:Lumazine-binding protein [Lentinula raphanica]|nr:Lumazine-binding protein [Lentinula raphanica]
MLSEAMAELKLSSVAEFSTGAFRSNFDHRSGPILDDCHIGHSIAVNGCCNEFDKTENGGWFKVWLSNETLERSDLDTTATIIERVPDGDSLRLKFQLPEPTPSRPSFMRYLISKGFVAIDGASLTLTEVTDSDRSFGEKIMLGKKKVGMKVNIEVDMVSKYLEKSVSAVLEGDGPSDLRSLVGKVVEEILAGKGLVK